MAPGPRLLGPGLFWPGGRWSRYAPLLVADGPNDDRLVFLPDDSTDALSPVEEEGDSATVAASPAALRSRSTIDGGGSQTGTNSTGAATTGAGTIAPADALFLEEVERTRVFGQLSFLLCIITLAGLPFVGGDRIVRIVLTVGVAICAVTSAHVSLTLRDASQFNRLPIRLHAVLAASTVYVGVAFWGVFSVAPGAVIVGLYFFGRSQSKDASLFIYVVCAGAQAVLSVLILSGVMQDPGLFPLGDQSLALAIFTQVLVQFVYFFSYALSRSTRASSLRAIEDLQRAQQAVSQREAQFQEVRQELDRALELGGAGRHTDEVVGVFKLGSLIGRGAMGEVYEAVNVQTGEVAAVKLLHDTTAEKPDAVRRFVREAVAAGAISSPYSVRVLDAAADGAAVPYLAMERLVGHDLAFHLRKRRRFSVGRVVELVEQVGSVIDLAREQGIVHRDIKPQNLFFAEQPVGPPVWKILDFGVSKLVSHTDTLTKGHVVGTPAYMAPEQARGKEVDHRADLYALAAIAYRCLTGRPPFSDKDVPALLYSVVYDMPPQPSRLADLPPQIDYVLAVGLAKRPSNRFESGLELAGALAYAAEGQSDDWLERRAEALLLELPWGSKR